MSKFDGDKGYDHSRKIGNEGDVIKHPVLAKVVESLAESVEKKPFVYAESHTGRPFYVLQKGGEWERGVGKLSVNTLLKGARPGWAISREGPQALANLRPYIQESFLGLRVHHPQLNNSG